MLDSKEAYKNILEEHIKDLKISKTVLNRDPFRFGWLSSRYNILEILGFKRNEIDTIEKVEKIIKKYNEEIKSWKQENSKGE